jgi:lipopolysaccharide biosynthesis glycosyltransferase
MKKNVILTLGIGSYKDLFTIPIIKKYAEKCDTDFILLTHNVINYANFYFEKFFFVDLLDRYERVLYMDADVLITPNAKNIFEEYPDVNKFYAFHENDDTKDMNRDYIINPLLEDFPDWPFGDNGKRLYFNAGIFLVSKPQQDIFKSFRQIPSLPGILEFGDQTYMNYLVHKNKVLFQSFDYSFNRMHLGNKDENHERLNANFIHYAGPDVYGNGNKNETMVNDYNKLYNK